MKHLPDVYLRAGDPEIPPGVLAPVEKAGGRTLTMCEEESQRPVRAVGIPWLAGHLG